MARRDGNIKDLSIPSLTNAWQKQIFTSNRMQIFNCLIFKELIKSISSCLEAKEVVSDMLEAYEEACAEDIALEAAMTVFSRKKQLAYVADKQIKSYTAQGSYSASNQGKRAEDFFSHIAKSNQLGNSAATPNYSALPSLSISNLPNFSLNITKSRDRYGN